MSYNENLSKARVNKNDEFYTMYEDIEKEISFYQSRFKGKIVYCPCDNPNLSNFTKYFKDNFEKLGIKRLVSTCYPHGTMEVVDNDGVKTFQLKGDGDFRSEECVKILKESDIVVTNPPFSLFLEMVELLMSEGKDFIILGNLSSCFCKQVLPFIKKGNIKIGYSITGGGRWFVVDDDYPLQAANCRVVDGVRQIRVKGIRWFSTFDNDLGIKKRPIPYSKTYNYKKFDNYEAYNIDNINELCYECLDKVGVPITIFDYDYSDYNLIGAFKRFAKLDEDNGFIIGDKVKCYSNSGKEMTSCGAVVDGKEKYTRIIIQRRTTV